MISPLFSIKLSITHNNSSDTTAGRPEKPAAVQSVFPSVCSHPDPHSCNLMQIITRWQTNNNYYSLPALTVYQCFYCKKTTGLPCWAARPFVTVFCLGEIYEKLVFCDLRCLKLSGLFFSFLPCSFWHLYNNHVLWRLNNIIVNIVWR